MEPKNLRDALQYQANAVVSSEIIKKETGTVTVFAFDRGQGLSEHTAPFDAFVYVLEGKADIKIDGQDFTLTGGQAIIMPGGKPHSVKAPDRFKMLLVMIK